MIIVGYFTHMLPAADEAHVCFKILIHFHASKGNCPHCSKTLPGLNVSLVYDREFSLGRDLTAAVPYVLI